jgi:hypothetical protein
VDKGTNKNALCNPLAGFIRHIPRSQRTLPQQWCNLVPDRA